MFPKLHEDIKELLPAAYFSGMEIPEYFHAPLEPNSSMEEIVSMIRTISIGSDTSGYIDDEGIHYHLPLCDDILVDRSKKFIFVSQPNVMGGDNPSAWQILSFLQDPVEQALFIALGRSTVIRKTPQTMALCQSLDEIWARKRFFMETVTKMVEVDGMLEKGLAALMKVHEEETLGTSSEMWEFWDTFGGYLMTNRLGLTVHSISY